MTTPPTEFVVRFLDPYSTAFPIAASDFTVNGIPAESVELPAQPSTNQELTFRYSSSPVTAEGLQQMQLRQAAVGRAADGDPLEGYSAQFGYDATPMVVTSVTPASGFAQLPLDSITVTFNEPYAASSLGVDDLQLSLGQVVQVNPLDSVTVQYVLGNLITEGELSVTLPDGAVTDQFGNLSTGFETTYTLEIGEIPFTTPLTAKQPMGSLIYDPVMSGMISSESDTDNFTIVIDPGQSISLLLETDSTLKGKLDLMRGDQVVGTSVASVLGENVIIQNDPVAGRLISVTNAPTEFVIKVQGAGATTGHYQLSILLNSAFEEETLGFPINDSPQQAQNLETAFRSLRGNSPDVAAVLGSLTGGLIVEDDFESGQLNPASWTSSSTSSFGQIEVTGSFSTAGGSYALIMDVGKSNEPNLNEAVWTVDLSGYAWPMLSFDHVSFGDEPNPFVGDFQGSFQGDGVAISSDGTNWHPVFDGPTSTNGDWISYEVDLKSAAQNAGISLNQPLHVKFQQYDDVPIFLDGRGWDNIQVRERDTADWYRIELAKKDEITLSATSQHAGNLQVELFDHEGQSLAQGLQLIHPLANGSFESSNLSGWQVETHGTPAVPWQVAGAGYGGNLAVARTSPQDGQFVAYSGFDGDGPMDTTLYQDVTIPADSAQAQLNWLQRIQWLFLADDPAAKSFEMQVRDPATNAVLAKPFSFTTPVDTAVRVGDTGWQPQSVDLSAFKGSTVRLAFFQSIPDSYSGPGQIELDQLQLDLGQTQYTNVTDVIRNFVVENAAEYMVRVSGDSRTDYSLLLTRNVDFNLEGNDNFASAQPLEAIEAGRHWSLGHLNGTSDPSDFYQIQITGPIGLETFTPAGADYEFSNQLDPLIRLYDHNGNLVAQDDNSNGGVNASLKFKPPDNGNTTYYIEVTAANPDSPAGIGEYVVAVRANETDAPPDGDPQAATKVAAAILSNSPIQAHANSAAAPPSDASFAQREVSPQPTAVDQLMWDLSSQSSDLDFADDMLPPAEADDLSSITGILPFGNDPLV